MFHTLGQSWEFAKVSYGIIWEHKRLLIFPILSTIAALLVVASFVLPLWMTGTIETWLNEEAAAYTSGTQPRGSTFMPRELTPAT